MTKFLRFKKAAANQVYIDIVVEACERLVAHGFFAKDDVLVRTGYDAGLEIRWDYVRRMIDQAHDTELIPLGPRFFKRHKRAEEVSFPAQFIAGSAGTTVGFAIASEANGHFMIERLNMKKQWAKGFEASAKRTEQLARKVGVLLPDDSHPSAPPLIEHDRKKEDEDGG